MNAETEEFLDNLRGRVAAAMDAIGNKTVFATQESISEYCPEFHTGTGGHSPVGGPPYLETGALLAGISCDVEQDENSVVLTVRSQRQGPSVLTIGGVRQNVNMVLYHTSKSGRDINPHNYWDLDMDVPQWLEEEAEGNRPYMRPQLDRLREDFLGELAELLVSDSVAPLSEEAAESLPFQ